MEKIKLKVTHWIESETGKNILTVMIIVLTGFGSFELGRVSKESGSSGIQIEYTDKSIAQEANVFSALEYSRLPQNTGAVLKTSTKNQDPAPSVKNFFASSRGTKYYSFGCSGGKTIKQENRIYFSTSAEAEKAGYSLSASCH